MSDLAEKNALIKELVRERNALKDELFMARRKLREKKEIEQATAKDEKERARVRALAKYQAGAVVADRHIKNLHAKLQVVREERDEWIHKYNHKAPDFNFDYLYRVCEAIAK